MSKKIREAVMVDEQDNEVGTMEIKAAHRNPVKLHRAISILLYNKVGQMLITKRAEAKFTWPGYWTNAVCANLYPGESYEDCANRRLKEELGIETNLIHKFSFIYSAVYDDEYGENEVDHVFEGQVIMPTESAPTWFVPDPNELSDWKWVDIDWLKKDLKENPDIYTPWFKVILERI